MRFAINPTPSPTRPADCYDVINADDRSEVIASSLTHAEATRMVTVLQSAQAEAQEDALQRLGRALFAVDSKHHLNGTECLCGFVGDARKRTQTEHITAAVLEEYRHD